MLKIGSNEIIVLMSINFLQKVEQKSECKNKDIVTCCYEYDKNRILNNTVMEYNDILLNVNKLDISINNGIYNKQIMLSISRLAKKELIVRVKHGYYAITENGYKEYTKRVLNNYNYSSLIMAI